MFPYVHTLCGLRIKMKEFYVITAQHLMVWVITWYMLMRGHRKQSGAVLNNWNAHRSEQVILDNDVKYKLMGLLHYVGLVHRNLQTDKLAH
jgi:hypothetical protein